ncbi:hypothetical protein GW17_00054008 [Ensete ventricosum]|nr:hypothetical protein GW17_00054008 [Ensete ventricosum]RZS29232.1 hypothetical protein BHM03_00062939 [Ensete ventricosum]
MAADSSGSTAADDQMGEGVGWPAQKRSSQWEPSGPTVLGISRRRWIGDDWAPRYDPTVVRATAPLELVTVGSCAFPL